MTSLQHVNPTVRGIRVSPQSALEGLAAHITQEITQGAQKPFHRVIDVSSGDPQKTGIKPISFVRQVLSVCMCPQLLKDKNLPLDVKQRAQRLLGACDGESVGSYSPSSGLLHVRECIAQFISRRDAGVPVCKKEIFISSGSQRALMVAVKILASGEGNTRTGVLTPTPCPHSLPMLMDEAGVKQVPYRLTEEPAWALDVSELHRAVKSSRGWCAPRAVYISNPGNPTGHVQDRKSIQEVIQFAAAERLLLLADEVYQDTVRGHHGGFVSYKKVLFEMGKEYSQTVQLISFHSLSNAFMRECGLRAGYMETVNVDPEVTHFIDTMLCTDISTPITGQLALEVMVDPPKPGEPSYCTFTQETLLVQAALSQNAQRACQFLNSLPGVSCQRAMGGIYLYPRLHLPWEFTEQAKVLEVEAQVLYCQKLLKEEGVLIGPGCQPGGTSANHHLRLCVLCPPDTLDEVLARLGSFHRRLMDGSSLCTRDRMDRDESQRSVTQHQWSDIRGGKAGKCLEDPQNWVM
ncbi:hypothetical protein Q5P01_015496 [Channa striata]|uniref:alanine transaminase n=1 Tax=Channa striata TaxID=64152 RepID=A0AA88MET0_CHASR|nr:hypothetical protein Q5P01_015496 [Channa striata]